MSSDRGIGSDSAFFGDSLCTSSDTCPCKQSSYHASIWTACASNDFLLVANKINLQPRLVNTLDRFGYSPLHYAAQGNHADIVRLLLFHGADPNGCASLGSGYVTNKESAKRSVLGKDPRPCGATPLHRAAFSGSLECCVLLLDAGAEINVLDRSLPDHRTPLHKAASQGHEDVVRLLLERGADPDALDAGGNSYMSVMQDSPPHLPPLTSNNPLSDEPMNINEITPAVQEDAISTSVPDDATLIAPTPFIPRETCSRCREPSIAFAFVRKQLVCMKCVARSA